MFFQVQACSWAYTVELLNAASGQILFFHYWTESLEENVWKSAGFESKDGLPSEAMLTECSQAVAD